MGNKTPPPARRPQSSSMAQMNHSPSPAPAAEGPLLRCPACTRTVRAPSGALRFRCPCGRVLAQPQPLLTSSASAPTMPPVSNPLPITTPSSRQSPQPLMSNTRSIPPSQQQHQQQVLQPPGPPMRVRCPSCQQVLLAPNAPQFQCPCGQMLRRPAAPAPMAGPPRLRVRCPRCATVLEAPPNARVFQCRCGIHLAPPPSHAQLSSRALQSGPGDIDSLSANLAALSSSIKPENVGNWRRRVVGNQLGWRKLFTEQDEALIMDAEEQIMSLITEEGLQALPTHEIKRKLTKLHIDTRACIEKRDLINKAIGATDELARTHQEPDLRRMLEERGLDPCICQDSTDLAARLFAYEWSEGMTTQSVQKDGYVRVLVNNSLLWRNAYDFLLPIPGPTNAAEIYRMAGESFLVKTAWFRTEMNKLRTPWENGHIKVVVRRDNLLEDGFHRLYNLPAADLHKYFRYEFSGEPGVDAGGVAREWFSVTSDASFNVDLGLFEYGGSDNVCYQISPNSGLANENHLAYFKFFGRLLGRALFEGQHVNAHLTRIFYKHLLAWPIVEADLEILDPELASSTKQIRELDDISLLALDFTTTISVFGDNQTIELKPGGNDIEVTNENRDEFLELRLKHLCMDRIAPQLFCFLTGFYEVVPLHLLSVFDFNEIELLLCGLPKINVDDWKNNTLYQGDYEALGPNHPVIRWFWEVITECNDEQRAKFLQFATGTARVPVQGFCALQGNDGVVKPFTVKAINIQDSVFPKAHTCFNRIDLPKYTTKEEMKFRMMQAMQLEGVGFQIE